MRNLLWCLQISVAVLFLTVATQSVLAAQVGWGHYSSSVFSQAKNQQKMVLLYAMTPWCHWCQEMGKNTFTNGQLASFIKANFIAVRINADEEGPIADQFEIMSLPQILVIDSNETVVKRLNGYFPPDELINELNSTL